MTTTPQSQLQEMIDHIERNRKDIDPEVYKRLIGNIGSAQLILEVDELVPS